MIFIDAQNLKSRLQEIFHNEIINYTRFADVLKDFTEYGSLFRQLVRTYYYDAEPEETDVELVKKQKEYHAKITAATKFFEIRLGIAKRDGQGKLKQKGVDALIALDMLTKAYENQYDVAILVSGDEDLLEIVRAVKNLGKQVYGAFFEGHISQSMKESFDVGIPLTKEFFEHYSII